VTGPYREPASVEPQDRTAARYVPMTHREERLRRVLRGLPLFALVLAAFLLERAWLVGLGLAYGVGVVVLGRMHEGSLNRRLKALAGTLAKNGDPHVAARNLESLVADSRPYPAFHSVALLFLGIARARGGDAQGALDLLLVVEHAGWLSHKVLWLAWLLPWLAQLYAVRDDLGRAQHWIEVATANLPADKHEVLVSPRTLVLLKQGKNDEAETAIERYVAGADASDPIREHFALLAAFARERAGKPVDANEVRKLVKSRAASPGRALPLEKWWADFEAFLVKYGA